METSKHGMGQGTTATEALHNLWSTSDPFLGGYEPITSVRLARARHVQYVRQSVTT
jgi:hypothetical protein